MTLLTLDGTIDPRVAHGLVVASSSAAAAGEYLFSRVGWKAVQKIAAEVEIRLTDQSQLTPAVCVKIAERIRARAPVTATFSPGGPVELSPRHVVELAARSGQSFMKGKP